MPKISVFSVKRAASELNVSPRTIRNWIDAGYFPQAYRQNPRNPLSPWRIPRQNIIDFKQARLLVD